jgi:hypothetical protein
MGFVSDNENDIEKLIIKEGMVAEEIPYSDEVLKEHFITSVPLVKNIYEFGIAIKNPRSVVICERKPENSIDRVFICPGIMNSKLHHVQTRLFVLTRS